MPPLPTIVCKDCGHVNEGERVYCHNCGTKLDRSQLSSQQREKESVEEQRRRVHKMMNPDAGLGRGWWKTALKTIGYALIVAVIVDAVLPPEGVPPMPVKGHILDAPDLGIALENLIAAPAGRRVVFLQDEINGYLKNKMRIKYEGSVLQNVMTYQRTFVNLGPGVCRITAQSAISNYSVYAGISYALKVENKTLIATPVGASLGRLQIPAEAVKYIGQVFSPLWEALRREHKLMDQVGSVEISTGQMVLSSKGPAPAPTPAPFVPISTAFSPPPISLHTSSLKDSGAAHKK